MRPARSAMRSMPTLERGRKIVEHVASCIVELLREIDAYPLSALRDV